MGRSPGGSNSGNAAFNAFNGYIIARCNFQYAHGFALIVDCFGPKASCQGRAQGYVALIIPDPLVVPGRLAQLNAHTANAGEQLTQ